MYYQPGDTVFFDGNWIPAEDARTSLYDQTLHYGYGAFEGIRSYKNADGRNVFRGKEHFDRLIDSASKLNITIKYKAEELVEIAYKLLEKNNLHTAYIRPLVHKGPNMELSVKGDVHLFMAAWPWKKYHGHDPIDVMISEYRKPMINPVNAKIVGNYTNSILASSQAKSLGFHEALMLDVYGFITEGPASNFFYEKEGALFTPSTKYALPGITRKTIIELAKEWGIEVIEKDITIEETYNADCAFFCGTATEVTPIGSINGEQLKGKWDESNAHSLYMMYRQQVMFNEYQGLTIV